MLQQQLKSFFKNKVVLCTGAAGSIGSALCRKLAQLPLKQLIILDQDETGVFDIYEELKNKCKTEYIIANIREKENIAKLFRKYSPDIVYHAAALKHVALMEKWPEEAYKTNIIGTINLIDAAISTNVQKFIFISSDKAVNPLSVMGKTKKLGEVSCLARNGATKFIVVRFGNVMPSRGSVVPIFQKLIAEGKNLPVTHKRMERYFMGIYDAAMLILKATLLGKGGEVFILDMGESMLISELAKIMVRLSGKDLDIYYTKPAKGEKLTEVLMTKEEKKRAEKIGNLYVIR